ncbi:FAD-binding oxidoreductase [Mycolicibacterium phocaicum]|jgi:decaprenylphospho-beta-D-ribofuranose 2-oxidase|uniref:Decaprenylphosphoryl-beta-D-ribose oxidase n=1 Tax=Mycolicibacterium phocaicum TaxID=319706 RepID=A0A7I7ZT51_9MYCO|nr:FAD-binding oxidoreductase [Mycolicibacterium phocaicum]TLH60354.1 decaprenylphosphoryl-beta-D-ribose oxidase [Mycolicibacterium phocaicum]TXH18396.1 MAG: FAD-binding oxidoreductase [Mycobacterium sp.]BBZ56982.1 putative oxidoreductase [Mycolicibacterium phocaicum]
MSTQPDVTLPLTRRALTGFGRTAPSVTNVLSTPDVSVIAEAVKRVADANSSSPAHLRRGILGRGLGRSYGDQACNGGGIVVDMTALNRIHSISSETAIADVDAGVSLDQLMKAALPFGLWVPVLPGTRQVTVGGAIASDIHGKNHHSAGSFGNHVLSLDLLMADGEVHTITPDGSDSELFWATVAGNGLTGIVIRARIKMTRTESAYFIADGIATHDLEETVAVHQDGSEDNYTYSSAWFDLISPEPKLGRAAVSRGSLAKVDQLPAKLAKDPLKFTAPQLPAIPNLFPVSFMNKLSLSMIGEAFYRMSGNYQGKIVNLTQFYHMLDITSGWQYAYGPAGFAQHQFLVPPDALEEFKGIIRWMHTQKQYSALNVFKLFGPGNKAPLSFPMQGWNVALDFPNRPGVNEFLNELDKRAMEFGGRVYTAKDSRVSAESFHKMYPRIDEWIATRRKADPNGVFASDMARRLELL